MACSWEKGVESYQYLSSLNPTNISLEISSTLLGSTCFFLLVGLDDESPLGVVLWCLVLACIVDVLGVSEFLGSLGEDGGAVINGDGWTIFRGFGWADLGILLLCFLLEVDLGVFMVDYENEEDEVRVNEGDWRFEDE